MRQALRSTAYLSALLFASSSLAGSLISPRGAASRSAAFALAGSHLIHASLIPRYLRVKSYGPPTAGELFAGGLGYLALGVRTAAPASGPGRLSEAGLLALFTGDLANGYLTKGRDAWPYLPLLGLYAAAATAFARSQRQPAPRLSAAASPA